MTRLDDTQQLYDDVKELGQLLYRMARQSGLYINICAHPKEEDEEAGDFLHVTVGEAYRYRESGNEQEGLSA